MPTGPPRSRWRHLALPVTFFSVVGLAIAAVTAWAPTGHTGNAPLMAQDEAAGQVVTRDANTVHATPGTSSRAAELVEATRASVQRWADVAAAEGDGYRSIGDALTGYEHFVHWEWAEDTTTLDPERPESLVYRVGSGGDRELVSAMYLLPPGSTMDEVPDLGDPGARWHDHDNLCWTPDRRVAGIVIDGRCVPAGEQVASPPMLHVWVVEHRCGPFAELPGHGEHGCDHAEAHPAAP